MPRLCREPLHHFIPMAPSAALQSAAGSDALFAAFLQEAALAVFHSRMEFHGTPAARRAQRTSFRLASSPDLPLVFFSRSSLHGQRAQRAVMVKSSPDRTGPMSTCHWSVSSTPLEHPPPTICPQHTHT